MKHWTEYLPEAGAIMKKGRDIQYRHDEIKRLQSQIKGIESDISEREAEIEIDALTQWTPKEIEQAKKDATNDGQMHPIFQSILKSFMP